MNIPVKHVSVTVDAGGNITCTPDPVLVSTHNALVAFTLDTDGYKFPDTNAVVINVPHSDFPYSAWTIKPKLAGIADLCNNADSYEYTVTVVNIATGKSISLDPVIKNGNPGGGN